jgi:hypothetical protein
MRLVSTFHHGGFASGIRYLSEREAIRLGRQSMKSPVVAHTIITEIDGGRIIFEAGRAPKK